LGRILGIDLGTTNCCVAVMEGTTPRVVGNREGSRTTASIVAFSEDGERMVGQVAKRQAITNPQNTIYAVKRLIGRKYADPEVQRAQEILPYGLAEASNGDVNVIAHGRSYSPEELSAHILAEIRTFAEETLEDSVSEAIITVPAYFNDAQRQATRDAGQVAGLEVLRIINEPTAAALAYGLERKEDATVAVYDLGGGTFDISILQISDGVFEVKATAGDTYLGGEDFDQRIMDWLIEEFLRETGLDIRTDRMALQRLKEAAERAKCELSVSESAAINLPFIATGAEGPLHLSRSISRRQFEAMVGQLVERTAEPCRQALKAAGLGPHEIDEILLVGGQTRSPIVAQEVEKIFGKAPNDDINPDEVVAVGAAIQGGILKGDVKDIVLLDVTPLSLGVETHGGLFTHLIERNATIPTRATQIFTTVVDSQDTVEIHVLQGEREIAAENKSLGRFELVGIPGAPRGVPQIEVTFAIDSSGIVNVSARDLATNKSQSVQINPAGGLSRDEVDRLVKEAARYSGEDAERRQLRRLRNRLEGLVYVNERVYDRFRSMLAEDDQRKMRETLSRARTAMFGDDQGELEAAVFDLNSLAAQLSDLMMGVGGSEGAEGSA